MSAVFFQGTFNKFVPLGMINVPLDLPLGQDSATDVPDDHYCRDRHIAITASCRSLTGCRMIWTGTFIFCRSGSDRL